MKKIRLEQIIIHNFKGIQELKVCFGEKQTVVSGYNGIGKTTIADAYNWVLFDKNIQGNTKFAIRPRDKQGNEVHDIVTSVELYFDVGGNKFKLCKEQHENLTKNAREQLLAESIAPKKNYYFVDNAPYQEKDYNTVIKEQLSDESIFALISNPQAFFNLEEKKQRELLFKACGTVDNASVDGWEEVNAIVGNINTPERFLEATSKRLLALKKDSEQLPNRIDELCKLVELHIDYELEQGLLSQQLESVDSKILLQNDMLTKATQGIVPVVLPVQPVKPIEPTRPNRQELDGAIAIQRGFYRDENHIVQQIANLRVVDTLTCPRCQYEIPKVDNTKLIESCQKQLADINDKKSQQDKHIDELTNKYNSAVIEYDNQKTNYETALTVYLQQYKDWQEQCDNVPKQDTSTIDSIRTVIKELESTKQELLVKDSECKQKLQIVANIAELKNKRVTIDDEMAKALRQQDVVKAFVDRKASQEMEQINKHFSTINFVLFEKQTNGENRACCKAVIDGVTYANTNFAKKIQAGIEIASLFADYYNISAPLFIDNKESVFELPHTSAQLILLQATDTKGQPLEVKAIE
ncbi:MAG: ATP-binding protein [Clostridiales bacterium]|jgi:DNA repair exonuclease SbcCD ATPase subunit|nr:ATP-binding protein [Clostridiales bacterium]